jgi:AraC family transcriptional regulator
MDYIETNLGDDLALDDLAGVAHFSPYHFHRVFRGMTGETLGRFIQRLRIEKAASKLINDLDRSVTAIAFECGFSGSASFARAFKEAFGMSATEWRSGGCEAWSKDGKKKGKDGKTESNHGQDMETYRFYIEEKTGNLGWRIVMKEGMKFQVEVKEMPEKSVVYVRHVGPYAGDSALFERLFGKLMGWAGPRGLLQPQMQSMAVYHDDPKVTSEDRLRLSVCITAPEDTKVDGEIGKMTVPAGKYAFARFTLNPNEYPRAWDAVMGKWLPESGFQPDDRPCFELYLNDPKTHPEGLHIVDICVPVKPLGDFHH